MAILFMDGAERNSTSKWTNAVSVTVASGSLGNVGSYKFVANCGSGTCNFKKVLTASQTELYLTGKFNMNNTLNRGIVYFFDSAGTAAACIIRNSTTGLIEIRLGTYSGSLLATGTTVLSVDVNYLIEVYYKPRLVSGGTITVKVNFITDVTYSGITTSGLDADIQSFKLSDTNVGSDTYIDDVVVGNSSWLGNQLIQPFVAVSDSVVKMEWTPSAGDAHDCIKEVTAVDTNYISVNESAKTALFNMTPLTGTILSVTALDVCARIGYSGSPVPSKQKITVYSGTTYSYGADISSLSFVDKFNLYEQNPEGPAVWTEATLNAAQLGITSVT